MTTQTSSMALRSILFFALLPGAYAQTAAPLRVLPAQPVRAVTATSATNAPASSAPARPQDDGAEDEEPEVLDPALAGRLDAALTENLDAAALDARANEIFDEAIEIHGDLELVDEHLAEAVSDAARRDAVLGLSARLSWRYGDLDEALADFEVLAEADAADLEAQLAHAKLLDASGKSKDALAAYQSIVDTFDEAALGVDTATRLRLRMALMSMESGGEEQKEALADFAREPGRSVELRNRCATVLALLGRPGDAADLYVVVDPPAGDTEPSEKKRQLKAAANGELRVAEWALRAEDWERAQGAAWRAVHLSTVAREKRYGLTLLAEAHRGDDSLTALLERFSTERDGLPPEARRAWIELLRETGSTDEAIAMTQGDAVEAFSRDDRRRLLEMYREAGRDEEMVAVYGDWIAKEPETLVWRSGLARHYLEQGDRAAAVAVWTDWFDRQPGAEEKRARPLDAADALESLGLDELAVRAAELEIAGGDEAESAFLFLYDLHRDRGHLEDARAALGRLDQFADPGSPARMPLSDCLERLGDQEGAVAVLEGVREARGPGKAGEDLEMRLAWLYSEVGNEEAALELWQELWQRVKSVARLRFVEDRMMTVASRLGVLADIAVELERKLYAGEADQKDSGLLVRLYTKVGDAVSAAEVIDEFLRRSGGTEMEALVEKARVYLGCNDYYHYEKTVAELVEIDPEGRPDYYRQLAMSQLERGKPDQARATLMKLQDLPGGDDTSAEFEAGVLALSGLREEAIAAYRRGLAAHPERIDSYLLMANLMKEVRQADRAVGMFQHLAETAERDDLFTIAIDGLLNMLVDAPPRPRMVQWARRITLERLAAREDRPYLYQLLADLAEETDDEQGQLRALENSLASAGPRRASVLRELMELSKPAAGGFTGPGRSGDRGKQLAFGRRLVGLGELVPPEVYLDLGDAFLEDGDEASAARTFDLTREFPDGDLYQQQAAERFEKAGFVERALERYQAVLAASPSDVPLLAKVGELREALGDDVGAYELYARAWAVLIQRKPLVERGGEEEEDDEAPAWYARNVDEYDQYADRVLDGLFSTLADESAVVAFLAQERAAIEAEKTLADEALTAASEGAATPGYERYPRLVARADVVRRLALATGLPDEAEALDRWAVTAFPGDEDLLDAALRARVRWGRFAAARALVDASGVAGERRERLLARLGEGTEVVGGGARVPFDTAISAVLPTFTRGDDEALRTLVRRTDLTSVEKAQIGRLAVLFSAARASGDTELALSIGRDWLRLDLEHGSYPYMMEQRIEGILTALDAETGLALGRYFVGQVLEDPEKHAQYVTLLPKLTQRFGDDVVDAEQVRTLLDGFGDRYAWGLGPVLALLPAADRAGALRGVWSKLEATNRAGFLLDLVSESTEDIPEEMASFITESLPAALDEADDFIEYRVGNLLDMEHSHALAAQMARQVLAAKPQFDHVRASLLVHRLALGEALVGDGGLLPEAAEVWVDLALDQDNDYQKRRAREKLVELFVEEADGVEGFVAALDRRVTESGEGPELARARVDLLLDAERDDEAAAAIAATLVADEVESELEKELLERRRRLELRRGERIAAALTLERLAELAEEEGDDATHKRHLRSLQREWTSLAAPERALAAKEALGEDETSSSGIPGLPPGFVLPPGAMISINGVMYTSEDLAAQGKKGLRKSFDDVREALAEGDADEAALIFRRLWRQFPVGQPAPPRFFSPRRYRNLALANLSWPADEVEEAEDEEPSKGGFLSYEPDAPEDPPEPPNAYERLAGTPEIVAEERRFLRTVRAWELDRLQPLLEGLLDVDVAARGEEAVMADLLARADAGETGRADQIQLLAMLDAAPERVTGAAADALSQLVQTIPPRDAAQVRRLARVLLQSGDEDVALRLYRWCALLASDSGRFGRDEEELDVVTFVSDRELVQEARDHLEGEAQLELIRLVLESSRPVGSPWMRENYETLVLDTWDEVIGGAEALERARAIAAAAIDTAGTGLRRRVALRAAPMFLAAGEMENALRAVEVGVAKLDPDEVAQPEDRWYRMDSTVPGRVSTVDMRRLLAEPTKLGEGAGDWYAALATTLEGWLAEDRVDASNTVQVLALAAIRLGEAGRASDAQALAQRLAARDDLRPATELWLVDALRAVGEVAAADERERALLASGRLHPERVPDVVARVLESEGAEAAFSAAAPVAEVSRHERLVSTLVAAAEAKGDETLAAEWREKGEAARAAEAALESD